MTIQDEQSNFNIHTFRLYAMTVRSAMQNFKLCRRYSNTQNQMENTVFKADWDKITNKGGGH